ncbi:hypothetical protein HDF12_000962 [Edaphobacter lichenicola]|uniref:Uncharacterized protein n=1 Tax=Tunturiibacter lichenicola TaxID=2051959 RepID=A0A7Y9NK17_9BACT|nr:hypothetical protein [Edaphobacter lichenicola]
MLSSMMQLLSFHGSFANCSRPMHETSMRNASIECCGFDEPDEVIGF